MAGPYYCDPAGSNTSPYDTWAKGATSIQTVLDLALAGEIIYCRGTQTLAAQIDVDTQTGTNAAGWIKVIGCNASGNVDGTRFILNGNNYGGNIVLASATSDMYWLENVEVKNTGVGDYGGFVATSGTSGWVFLNCCVNNCGGDGFDAPNFAQSIFIRCVAYLNTGRGFDGPAFCVFCASRDNTGSGFLVGATTVLIGCISHGNTDDGAATTSSGAGLLFNCVADGNGDDGVYISTSTQTYGIRILGCRITNHSGAGDIGLNANSEPCITGWCYFEDNDGDNIQNAAVHNFIPAEGGSTTSNVEDQADTDEGYVDKANHDFSTDYTDGTDPSLRRTAITIPWE